jgi:hypothetical protein
MKKIIDIPDKLVIDLKILAAKDQKPLKNFIESQLEKIVDKAKRKEAIK